MTSPEYERFRQSFSDDTSESVRQGLDLAALRALHGAERDAAEAWLVARLDETGDTRAVLGLDALRSPRAAPGLARLYEATRGHALGGQSLRLVYACVALWHLGPDPRWLDAVIDVARHATSASSRRSAVAALAEFDHPDARYFLTTALDDRDALTRHAAARALLTQRGVAFDTSDNQHAIYRVMSPDAATRAEAARWVRDAVGAG